MPKLISRDEALAQIVAEGNRPPCLMCAVLERKVGPVYAVYEDDGHLVMLPRYVRRWGHVLVVPKPHVTLYSQFTEALWSQTNALALRAARMIEEVRKPRRVYVTSTGSSAGELIQTSMHVHLHVIPVPDAEDRPADLFSWAGGVLVGEHEEWIELRDEYKTWWQKPS